MLTRSLFISSIALLAACSSSDPATSDNTFHAGAGGKSASGGAPSAGGASAAGAPAGAGAPSAGGAPSSLGGAAGAGGSSVGGAAGSSVGGSSAGGVSGAAGAAQAGAGGSGGMSNQPLAKKSLIWIWLDYKNSLDAVVKNAKSFTHVSPALYQLNYAYSSGVPKLDSQDGSDNFDGLTGKQMATAAHAVGLKVVPLMYAGAGNNGVEDGIHNVLNDSPPGTQKNFIDSTIAEATAKGFDGWNLDWEVDAGQTQYNQYGQKLVTFLTAYSTALHQHNMELSYDLGGWFTRQCGDNNGFVDLTKIGNSLDQMIMEDYSGTFGGPAKSCPATNAASVDCNDYVGELNVMCNLPKGVVNIGLISPYGSDPSTNPFAPDALNALDAYGFTSVSLWPDGGQFIDSKGIPNGQTWYSLLAAWLAKK